MVARKTRSTVKVELRALEMVIESYKAKNNFYPPDNPKDYSRPPLFYELTGTTNVAIGGVHEYHSRFASADPPLNENDLMQIFGMKGFLNAGQAGDESEVQSFYKNLLPRQVREIPAGNGAPPYKVLVAPRHGMDRLPAVWHYNKTSPTNNVGEFDLWAEIDLRGDKVIIGNWEN